MPVLMLILLIAVFAYFLWRHKTSDLTRNCRWRQNRAQGIWRCAFCGAKTDGLQMPSVCMNRQHRPGGR